MKHVRKENRAIGSSSSMKCRCCDEFFVQDQICAMRK